MKKIKMTAPVDFEEIDIEELGSPDASSSDEVEDIESLATDEEPGSQPLENEKHEAFCQLVFQGLAMTTAYREAVSPGGTCSHETCKVEAKRLGKQEDVQQRIIFLKGRIQELSHPAERMDAIKFCSKLMRSSNKPTILRLQALDRLGKILHWFDTPPARHEDKAGRPDPAWFCEYVRRIKDSKGISSP